MFKLFKSNYLNFKINFISHNFKSPYWHATRTFPEKTELKIPLKVKNCFCSNPMPSAEFFSIAFLFTQQLCSWTLYKNRHDIRQEFGKTLPILRRVRSLLKLRMKTLFDGSTHSEKSSTFVDMMDLKGKKRALFYMMKYSFGGIMSKRPRRAITFSLRWRRVDGEISLQ